MWLGGEDQETWLGYDGLGCYCAKGKLEAVKSKLEKGLGVDGLGATLKSKRSSNR
jgi:hypothetical protein